MTEGAVYERIKHWLLAQTLVPGQLLQIGVLADELGVSTTPVREALTRLAAERMIMSVPKRGFFARTPSEDDILGLYSVNQTILDAAQASRSDLPFACKGGVCGTCRAKVTRGEVDMRRNYALEPAEVDAGFVLTCQTYPVSDDVTVDFDA